VAATTNLTLSGTQTFDGVVVAVGDAVGVFGQTTGAQNGVYVVQPGPWTRRSDMDVSAAVTPGMFVWSTDGTAGQDSLWELKTEAPIILGTTALVFEAKAGKAAGLALSSDLTAEIAARAAADTALQTNLTNEGTTRAAADTANPSAIAAEAAARAGADTTLQTNITNEASTRAAGDSTNAAAIAAEVAARQAMIVGGKIDPP
jgi:phage-related tail fiber protein